MPFDTITISILAVTLRLNWLLGKKGFVNFDLLYVSVIHCITLYLSHSPHSLSLFLCLLFLASCHLCHRISATAPLSLYDGRHPFTHIFSDLLINLAIILSVSGNLSSHKIYIRLSKWYEPPSPPPPQQQQQHKQNIQWHTIFSNLVTVFFFFNFHVTADCGKSATNKLNDQIQVNEEKKNDASGKKRQQIDYLQFVGWWPVNSHINVVNGILFVPNGVVICLSAQSSGFNERTGRLNEVKWTAPAGNEKQYSLQQMLSKSNLYLL